MKAKPNREDVLFLASLHPNKRGSFEDYICHLASECTRNNISIKFVFGNGISSSIKHLFKVHNIKYRTLKGNEFNSMKILVRMLIETRPKLVHINFISFCNSLIPICRLMGIKKMILTDHSSGSIGFRESKKGKHFIIWLIKYWRRRLWASMVNRFIAVSGFVTERLRTDNGIPSHKIKVIYNGVNLERFSPLVEKDLLRRQLILKDKSGYIVSYIGQLISEKGVLVFLDAAKILLRKHKDIVFPIVGSGPQMNLLQDSAKELGMEQNILFLGNRDDVEVILGASDILVCPSVWDEAFGLVIAEAMASGVPVVASNVGGIPEVIANFETGILVSPNNSKELAKTIDELLVDEKTRKNFGVAGRKRAEEYFTIGKMAGETTKLYQELL